MRGRGRAWEKAGGAGGVEAAEALEVVARRYWSHQPKPSPPRRTVHLAVSSRGNLRAATAVGKVPRGRRSRWRE